MAHEHRYRFLREQDRVMPGASPSVRVDIFYCETCLEYEARKPTDQLKGKTLPVPKAPMEPEETAGG
jgi:hypothetical protein